MQIQLIQLNLSTFTLFRFELPLNMNSLSDLGPVDFLSRYNLMIIAIMKGSLR